MLDPRVTELARRGIDVQFDECREQLRREIELIQNDLTGRGIGRSGILVAKIHERCEQEVEMRVRIVWDELLSVLSATGVRFSESLATDLKAEVEGYFLPNLRELNETVARYANLVQAAGTPSLDEARIHALRKIAVEIDRYALHLQTHDESVPAQAFPSQLAVRKMATVFISHISEEAWIASTLKKHIESTLAGQVKVFVSSDPRDLPAGTKWLERISQAIESAEMLVVLCSPAALKRPWINFEMGCGWEKKVPIIPVCHSSQKKGELPAPISEFQALEMDSETFVANFFDALTQHLKIQGIPKIDQNAIKEELLAALRSEPVAVPETAVAEVELPPAPEELDDKSLGILKAIADMGDEGFAAEDLAGHFGMSRPKMEHYLEKLVRGGHVTYRQEIVDDPPVVRLEEKGRTYLSERDLL